MASRQTRQSGTTAPGQGGGMGAPGTTGAPGARDLLGAPGSTGASMTNMGAPGYDPTDYRTGSGEQQQLHRSGAGADTQQGYTYGTGAGMEPTTGGYQAGVPVHATEVTGTYDRSGAYQPGHYTTGTTGGGGYDTGRGMGGQARGAMGEMGERTERIEVTRLGDQPHEFEEMGGHRARGVGGGEKGGSLGGYDTGGWKEREGQQRRG